MQRALYFYQLQQLCHSWYLINIAFSVGNNNVIFSVMQRVFSVSYSCVVFPDNQRTLQSLLITTTVSFPSTWPNHLIPCSIPNLRKAVSPRHYLFQNLSPIVRECVSSPPAQGKITHVWTSTTTRRLCYVVIFGVFQEECAEQLVVLHCLLGFLQELCSSSVLQVFYLMSFFFSCLNWQQTGNLRLADWFIIAFIAVNMRFIGNYCSQQDYSEVLPSIVDGDVQPSLIG